MQRTLVLFAGAWLLACAGEPHLAAARPPAPRPPNLIVVLADDLGYGDLGCYGARGHRTPHLDRLAREGVRFTDFYVAQPVCSASRAALLTGCYPNRIGITGALGPDARVGLAAEETTLAELLKARGYATAAFGKWHLGHRPEFLPTRHGFDRFFGIPYSNDMWPLHPEFVALPPAERARRGYPPLPLFEGEQVAVAAVGPAEQQRFTRQFTARAVEFVRAHAREPFFVYLAHPMPHVPLFVAEGVAGRSGAGLLGDVIEELDDSVGQLLAALDELGLGSDTLLVFTSDNGPWLSYGNHGGSAGGLREGKGTTFEGGVRVPFLARWPGRIPAGSLCAEPAMTIDLVPTVARLLAAPLPGRPIDGADIWPLLAGEAGARSPHAALFFYYHRNDLEALRSGQWKLCLPHASRTMAGQPPGRDGMPGPYRQERTGLMLFDLKADPGETRDVATEHPDVVARLRALAAGMRADLGDDLVKTPATGARAPGRAAR